MRRKGPAQAQSAPERQRVLLPGPSQPSGFSQRGWLGSCSLAVLPCTVLPLWHTSDIFQLPRRLFPGRTHDYECCPDTWRLLSHDVYPGEGQIDVVSHTVVTPNGAAVRVPRSQVAPQPLPPMPQRCAAQGPERRSRLLCSPRGNCSHAPHWLHTASVSGRRGHAPPAETRAAPTPPAARSPWSSRPRLPSTFPSARPRPRPPQSRRTGATCASG